MIARTLRRKEKKGAIEVAPFADRFGGD